MDFTNLPSSSASYLRTPGWVRGSPDDAVTDATLRAGAALALVDQLVRQDTPWRGAWLDRLAVDAAAASLRLLRRPEDVGGIRDAHHLCRPGDDPGPAGRIYALWRRLATRRPSLDQDDVAHAAGRSGIAWSDDLEAIRLFALSPADGATPLAAGLELIASHQVERLDTLPVLLWLADTLVARRAGWPVGVPLLAGTAGPLAGADATNENRRQSLVAYARAARNALDSARAIADQAAILQGIAGKLRAKGAPAVVTALLEQDAVGPGLRVRGLSDRGLRRLYERLLGLGAIRELTGRATFRLYGL
ncbi:MAG: DUF1403 family protein [Thalassobaculaceae bacterium]